MSNPCDVEVQVVTLPTIHLNGTGADTLQREYQALYEAVNAASDLLSAATCNARDFYPQTSQDPGAFKRAQDQREEMFRLLAQVSDYAEAWVYHAWRHKRISGRPVA